MKLCKGCLHYIATSEAGDNRCRVQFYECRDNNLITGLEIDYPVWASCFDMRYGGKCGEEARLFEPPSLAAYGRSFLMEV